MNEILKKIIDNLNKNYLDKTLKLCEKNDDKKIEYIICNIKGVVFFKQNRLELAKHNFIESIRLDKNFLDPYKNLFKLCLRKEDLKSAVDYGKKIIELEPKKNPLSYFNLALAYDLNKDYKNAIDLYKVVEKLDFKEKKILFNNLAKCFLGTNNLFDAKNYYLKALEFDQGDKFIINNLLILYLRVGNKEKAEYFYNKAKIIDENYIEFKLNKSDFLLLKDKTEEAIKTLESIIDTTKSNVAYTKLTKIYLRINDYEKAIKTIDDAIIHHPNINDLKFTRGMIHLLKGEYDEGWNLYEYRDSIIKDGSFESIKKWQGENIKNSHILVTCEQGMGDVLQFSKFLLNLSPLCKKIDFLIYDKLLPIFNKKVKNINVCEKSEISENSYDYKISLGSLNKYFYKDKKFYSFDLVNFNEDKKKKWSTILQNNRVNIGLIWSGNFFGPKEPYRSIELKNFKNLIKLNANFYSFQNEIWERDKEFFKESDIIDYSKEDFSDVMGIIQNLDLVISTDTFFLHLACICDKETWGLISQDADWRWYDYYKYNPYQALKIYKQSTYKSWDNVIEKVQNDLKKKFNI